MYNALYWVWCRQEELKNLGYEVHCYFGCSGSFYTHIFSDEDCNFLTEVFDFNFFDNWKLVSTLNTNEGNFENHTEYKLINNYRNAVRCYLEKENSVDNLNLREFEDLLFSDRNNPKNFFSEKVKKFCEEELKKFPEDFVLIHFRQYENLDINKSFSMYEQEIDSFVNKYKNEKIIFITSSEKTKELMKKRNYGNILFNNYIQKESWICRLKSEELFDYLKNTITDMYLVCYAKKIMKLGVSWNSNFLIFGTINNKTSISNRERFNW